MKKLMKAIAFATVMCMLLSTVAFAAVPNPVVDYDTKTLNITFTGNGASEQVSLLILKKDANLNSLAQTDILYINQTVADGEGTATFTATLDTTETAVDIYSGNATYAAANSGGYQELGDVTLVAPVTEVTIVKTESGVVKGTDGVGVYADVAFTKVPTGYTLSKMVWALKKANSDEYIYTNAVSLDGTAFDSQSGIKFAAFIPTEKVSAYDLEEGENAADAIFLFVKDGESMEAYSANENIHSGKQVNE